MGAESTEGRCKPQQSGWRKKEGEGSWRRKNEGQPLSSVFLRNSSVKSACLALLFFASSTTSSHPGSVYRDSRGSYLGTQRGALSSIPAFISAFPTLSKQPSAFAPAFPTHTSPI
eukprot:3698369-Rhodomonas_salina.1